jgi:hypothetical protein
MTGYDADDRRPGEPPGSPAALPMITLGTIGAVLGVARALDGEMTLGVVSFIAGVLIAAQPTLRAVWWRLGYDEGRRDGARAAGVVVDPET